MTRSSHERTARIISSEPMSHHITDGDKFTPQSIIIKFWMEPQASGPPQWRGRITHIPSGHHTYVASLWEIISFFLHYLKLQGLHVPWYWRIPNYLHIRLKRKPPAS